MDLLQAQPESVQRLWPQIPPALQLDVLDLLQRTNLTDAEKLDAMTAASTAATQEDFIPYNPLLKDARNEASDAAETLLYEPEISKLNFACVFCKSKNTLFISTQTRSADEATPVRIVCLDCSKTSIERG